jgi:hypothetical protein
LWISAKISGDNLSVAWRFTVVIDPQTIGKMADASGEIAKTTNTAMELIGRFGRYFEGKRQSNPGVVLIS